MHSIPGCGYCAAARRLLNRRGVPYEERAGDPSARGRRRLAKATGGSTFPQIVVDGRPVGGYRELKRFARAGGLGPPLPRRSLWSRIAGRD